jgi:hypothetical protein
MKTLRILLCLVLITVASKAQIPNASFENWYTPNTLEYATGWMTSDSLSRALQGGSSAFKGSDPYDGTFSLHLKSVTVGFTTGPGVATNGVVGFNGTAFVFSGGTPDTTHYRFLTGQFKYTPTNPLDQGRISVLLSRNATGTRDTIGFGTTTFDGTISSYTSFFAPIIYKDYINPPDTFLIVIQSSKGIADPNLGIGSELVIDSLNFSGLVGIEEAVDVIKSLNVYPSPAHNQLNVAIELKKKVNMNCNIYDLNGKQVLNITGIEEKQSIDISSLAKGNYILKLSDEKNNVLSSKNFVKE